MIWSLHSTGNFSLKTTYEAVRPKKPFSFADSKMWTNHLPKKISFFMSNLWRGKIPLDEYLVKFNISGPSMCVCCRASEETCEHVFNSGPRALNIWNFFQRSLGITGLFPSLKQRFLLWWNQKSNNPMLRVIFQITPSVICWFLWRARNEGRFNFSNSSSTSIISDVVKLVSSCVQVQFHKIQYNTHSWFAFLDSILNFKWKISALQVPWISAHEGYTLNTDGSSMHIGTAAAGGGILRDSYGGLIFAFSSFFGYGSNMNAESISLFVGLSICQKLQVNNVAVRSDSKVLIDILNEQATAPWNIQPLIRKISRYKHLIVDLSHCYRESNCVADALAKDAQLHRSTKFFTSMSQIPPKIRALIHMDSIGVCNFRFSKSPSYS